MSNAPTVALLSSDLMFSSGVSGAAAASGATLHVAASVDEITRIAAREPLKLVILDLATSGVDAASAAAQLRALSPAPTIIAYGPHVHSEKLAAARDAGCDAVLTRGQFHSQMREVIARWVKP